MAKRRPASRTSDRGLAEGYRSGLEGVNAAHLRSHGVEPKFETIKIPYVQPEKKRTYTPDFPELPSGIIIETKGRFTTEDRQKHLWIKQQHPHLDIRFVFSNSRTRIRKGSPTTYADWCQKNGFLYADKLIPESWMK
jgi:hypothetical protein